MILALLLGGFLSAPLEIGGALGGGSLLGSGSPVEGRDPEIFEAVRYPATGSIWLGYEWLEGALVGIRYQRWRASGAVVGVGDLGAGAFEDLSVEVYGFLIARRWSVGPAFLRAECGVGFATAEDELRTDGETIAAEGEGSGWWLRGGLELPVRNLSVHLGGGLLWTPFTVMRSEAIDSYKSDFALASLEGALSYRF